MIAKLSIHATPTVVHYKRSSPSSDVLCHVFGFGLTGTATQYLDILTPNNLYSIAYTNTSTPPPSVMDEFNGSGNKSRSSAL